MSINLRVPVPTILVRPCRKEGRHATEAQGCPEGPGVHRRLDEFRRVLADVKAELYPDVTDETLTYTRDEAGAYCAELRKRLNAPRLSRVFILKALISLRRHGWKRKEAAV